MSGRRGLTLAELMIGLTIALALTAVCQALMSRADRLFDVTRRRIDLAVGTRALVETLVKDVASSFQMSANAAGDELTVIRAADAEVDARLRANPSWAFPFVESSGSTTQRQPALRVTYAHDAAHRTIVRREEPGVLESSADTGAPAHLTRAVFTATSSTERVLCASVTSVAYRCLGLDADRRLVTASSPQSAELVVLQLHARHDEGVYAGPTDRPVPDVQLAMPFWSIKRRSDAVYPESFSSTDEDLSW